MNNAIIPVHHDMTTMEIGTVLAKSGCFEDTKTEAQAIVKVLAGQELGFGPIASMTGIHFIKGKVAVGANLIAAAVKRSPKYDYRVLELSDAVCELAFYEGGKDVGRSRFTAADAQKAGTQNMQRFPKNMLFARALSNGVKWYAADIFLGAPVYTPEELGATVDDNDNIIVMAAPKRDSATIGSQPALPEPARQPRSAENMGECTSCNAPIAWVKTPAGKNMPYDVDDDGVRTDIVHWSTCPNADSHRPKPADVAPDRQRQAKIARATAMLNNPKLPASFDSPDNVNDLDGAALDALIKALADVLNKPAAPPADTQHADDLPF